jgi:hypothetical protein
MTLETTATDDTTNTDATATGAATGAGATDTGPATSLEAIDQALGYSDDGAAKPDPNETPAQIAAREAAAAGKPGAAAVDPKAAKPAAPAAAAKPGDKKDEDLTKMPPGLKADAQQRFQALTNRLKEKDAEIAKLSEVSKVAAEREETIKGFQTLFDDAKCQPQQFQQALDFIKCVNTGNFQQAANIVTEQMRLLSLATGQQFGAPDALEGFPDLQKAVADGQTTQQHALELARARTSQAAQQGQQRQREQSQQQQQQAQQAVESGATKVQQWVDQVSKTDIDWPAKEAAMDKEIDWLAANVHPSQWVTHLQKFYQMMSVSGNAIRPPSASNPQPLRANSGAGGAKVQPQSMLEAINQGLGYAEA